VGARPGQSLGVTSFAIQIDPTGLLLRYWRNELPDPLAGLCSGGPARPPAADKGRDPSATASRGGATVVVQVVLRAPPPSLRNQPNPKPRPSHRSNPLTSRSDVGPWRRLPGARICPSLATDRAPSHRHRHHHHAGVRDSMESTSSAAWDQRCPWATPCRQSQRTRKSLRRPG